MLTRRTVRLTDLVVERCLIAKFAAASWPFKYRLTRHKSAALPPLPSLIPGTFKIVNSLATLS